MCFLVFVCALCLLIFTYMSSYYEQLIKPEWAPPAFLFGPVWTVLYVLIIVSFGYVVYLYTQKKISFVVLLPFLLNVIFNVLFTPLQFGLESNVLALIDIVLVLGTLIWAMVVIFPHARWVTYVQIPYLLWVSFATVLQVSITYLNW